VDVVDRAQSNGSAKALTKAALLEHDDGNDQSDEREPGDGRQDGAEEEDRHRQEDNGTGREPEQRPPVELGLGYHGYCAYVGRAEHDAAGRRHQDQPIAVDQSSRDRRQDGRAHTECQRAPEAPAVEPDRIRDQLADRALGRRRDVLDAGTGGDAASSPTWDMPARRPRCSLTRARRLATRTDFEPRSRTVPVPGLVFC